MVGTVETSADADQHRLLGLIGLRYLYNGRKKTVNGDDRLKLVDG